ncbi:MAG: tRNA uracil 4-sulfurtransferase ThiI, partial [Bacilli bacterium]
SKQINTYNISILPYEDCCTIFLPPNPIIYPKKDMVISNEALLDIDQLIYEAINKSDKIVLTNENINELLAIETNLF